MTVANYNLNLTAKAVRENEQPEVKHSEEMLSMRKLSALNTMQSKVKLKAEHDVVQKHCGEFKTNSALPYRSTASPRSQMCGYCWFVWVLEDSRLIAPIFLSLRQALSKAFLIALCFPFSLFLSFPSTHSLLISHFLWLFGFLPSQLSRSGITGSFLEAAFRINNTFLVFFS